MTLRTTILALIGVMFLVPGNCAWADGSEVLAAPPAGIATGTGIVAGGVGLFGGASTIDVDVPFGAAVQQVFLYWSGLHSAAPGGADDSAVVDGTAVSGVAIGGPTLFWGSTYCSAYRADISAQLTLVPGSNAVAISGLSFDIATHGAAIVAVVDDGSSPHQLHLVDGLDLAFHAFQPPLDATVAQVFSFPAVSAGRTATLQLLVADVQPLRPHLIRVTSGTTVTDHANLLGSSAGAEWDLVSIDVPVPAAVDAVSVEVISAPDGSGNLPSSLAWIAASLTVPPDPAGEIDDQPFVRGDGNDDGAVDVSDVVFIAHWVAAQGSAGSCLAAADANADDGVDLADAVYLASFLFAGGTAPSSPFGSCGGGGACAAFLSCP